MITFITFINVFNFLDNYAIQQGACGMGIAIIVGTIPLLFNFIWSSATVFLVSKTAKKQYFDDTLLYVSIAIIGHSLIAFFVESYLWLLLIIPYLLFLGESFYLKNSKVNRI